MASNRIGKETSSTGSITFYGGSVIAGPRGDVLAQVHSPRGLLALHICTLCFHLCLCSSLQLLLLSKFVHTVF